MFYKSMKKNRKMEHLKMFSTFGRRWLWISMNMLIWMIVVLPNVYGQQSEKLISLNVNQVSVLEAIQQINLLSDNSISYKREELEKEVKKVTLNLTDVKVLTAVRAVLNGSRLEAMVHGEVILIVPQKDARTSMQMINVKGVVTDKNKIPMPGVTVKLVGASIGTATNVKGFFSLQLPAQNGMLEFSFVGYKSRKIDFATNMRDTIRVVLEEDIQSMDEVIVTGYQNIDKRMNTSAVQTLKMDEIRVAGVQTVDQLLESRVPGMIFMQNSGQVGATPKIRVRGTSTVLGNQEPVWVLDGIVLHDPVNVNASLANSLDFVNLVGNAISGINPEDIERIDILKDASATALYGAKAANGVIVITTKKGKVGTPALSYSMSGTFTARPRYTDKSIYFMTSKERIAYSREIMEKGLSYPSITNWVGYEGVLNDFYQGNITGEQMLQEIDRLETVNTDWFDLMMRDAFSHSHTLSLSGGTDNIRYYASLGYSDEVGVIRKEGNKRYTTNMNINGTFNKFSFQFSLTANKGERNYANSEIDILNYAYYTSRAIPAYNEDGTLFYYNREGGPGSTKVGLAFNALNEMNNCRDEYTNSGITLTSNLNYSLNESLKGQFIFSYAINNNLQESFLLANTWYAANLRGTNYGEEMLLATKAFSKMPYGGEYRQTTTRNESYTTRLQLDFNKFLDKDQKHLINAAIGFEASSSTYKGLQRTARGYIPERGKMFVSVDYNQFPAYAEWALTNETAKGIMTDNVTNELSGYFTLSYTYNNAYTVNFNTRADASNKFGSRSNEKLLPVWSVSGTWDIAGALDDDLVLGGSDHQGLAVGLDGVQERTEVLGLDAVELDGIDNDDLACGRLGGQSGLHSQSLDLLIQNVRVAAGLGSEHDAAVGPLRRTGAALTGVAGTLLTPGLLAAAGDLGTGQSALRALTAIRQVVLDHFMHNSLIGLDAKNAVAQLHGTDGLAGHVQNVDGRHYKHSFPYLLRAEAFWGLRPEAFCGLLLMPLSACLTRWVLTVLLMRTRPPLGPGTAPRTAMRFRSASTLTMSRFWMVTWSTPIWPAPILPLKIREGSVEEPMEPA